MPSTAVFALIPHFGRDEVSNQWLRRCVESLLQQTVALDGIIVVDDASPCTPMPVVNAFSGVSLYRNTRNTGPFSIIDRVFAQVGADALLLQDSDDWSGPDRLQLLRDGMHQLRADIVGCQIQAVSADGLPLPGTMDQKPFRPREALLENPVTHPLILPSALVSCAFVRRIGGFSTGLRFGADSEFVRRASFGGRVRNISDTCYFRRIHPDSLTQAPSTGFGSPARVAVQKTLQDHARTLAAEFQRGGPMDLRPQHVSPPVQLQHVVGPAVPGL